MNNRIKELALISGFVYEPNKDQLWVNGSTEVMISHGLEKFAELLIEDCIRVINHGMDHTDYDDNVISMVEFLAQKWCRDAIKEHFGVK